MTTIRSISASSANPMETERMTPTRFRLAWRWKKSGLTGASPWLRDSDIVEGWLDSLSLRHGEKIQHWIEADGKAPAAPEEAVSAPATP